MVLESMKEDNLHLSLPVFSGKLSKIESGI